jgi:ABC-type uncharacterized transport system involved in gliding motility auxiliary subunit
VAAIFRQLGSGLLGRRSTQVGTNAIIATLAMLVILGLINFLGVRYAQRVDLTENQLFTLSPLSQRVVRNLQQPVKVWLFDPKPNPADQELLKNYRRYGSKLDLSLLIRSKNLDWLRSLTLSKRERFTWNMGLSGSCCKR